MNSIKPPWTPEQVAALNAHQHAGEFHPYTCGNRNDEAHHLYAAEQGHGDHGILLATTDGWMCPVCDYRQCWAWEPPRWLTCPVHCLLDWDGGYSIVAATLPGVGSQGDNLKDALANMHEALEGVLLCYRDDLNMPVPWQPEQPLNPGWERRILLVEVPYA